MQPTFVDIAGLYGDFFQNLKFIGNPDKASPLDLG